MYAVLTTTSPDNRHLFRARAICATLAEAASLADDAVYGAHHVRALVIDLDGPILAAYDTNRDGPYRNCPRCSGHGRYQIAVDDDTECEGCNGTGHTDTPERWVTCPGCNGTRRLDGYPCYACDATGVQEDWEAHF